MCNYKTICMLFRAVFLVTDVWIEQILALQLQSTCLRCKNMFLCVSIDDFSDLCRKKFQRGEVYKTLFTRFLGQFFGYRLMKNLQLQVALPPDPQQGIRPWTPLGAFGGPQTPTFFSVKTNFGNLMSDSIDSRESREGPVLGACSTLVLGKNGF